MKKALLLILQLLLSAAIIAASVYGAKYLMETKKVAEKVEIERKAPLVRASKVREQSTRVYVRAMGEVLPEKEVTITPQVGGKIEFTSAQLVVGGSFGAGDVIFKIDSRDFELAVDQQKAQLEQALFSVKVEEGKQIIAQREWQLVGSERKTSQLSKDLALRKPHLENARAALKAARSGLERAKLDVERCTIKAPFKAVVVEEFVDKGQVVTPQTKVARLVGQDRFWVRTAVKVEDLSCFALPEGDGGGGAWAEVLYDAGNGKAMKKKGQVMGLLANLEPRGHMARVLIAVDDPLRDRHSPLLLGTRVEVSIEGRMLENVVLIPRKALHRGEEVYVINEQNRLEIRRVSVLRLRENEVIIDDGLSSGERIITSHLANALPNMLLRLGA